MALKKISELSALTTLTGDDLFVVIQDPTGTPITQKITVANAIASLLGADHNADGSHKGNVYEVGDIKETIRSTAPEGWLLCTGATTKTIGNAASGADYADAKYEELFTLIQSAGWGTPTNTWAANGTVTLPDFRDVVRVGVSGTKALASSGGSATINLLHAHTVASHVHTISHTHTLSHTHTMDHTHTFSGSTSFNTNTDGAQDGSKNVGEDNHNHTYSGTTSAASTSTTSAASSETTSASSAANSGAATPATNNQLSATQSILPPYKATNVIIKY